MHAAVVLAGCGLAALLVRLTALALEMTALRRLDAAVFGVWIWMAGNQRSARSWACSCSGSTPRLGNYPGSGWWPSQASPPTAATRRCLPAPSLPRSLLAPERRARHAVDHRCSRRGRPPRPRPGRTPDEHGQGRQHRPFQAGQQLPGPVHQCPQRLLPQQPGPRPARQQDEQLSDQEAVMAKLSGRLAIKKPSRASYLVRHCLLRYERYAARAARRRPQPYQQVRTAVPGARSSVDRAGAF